MSISPNFISLAAVPSAALTAISLVSLALAIICALAIAADLVVYRPQKMAVMNVVWPLTAIYAGPLGLLAYFSFGRARLKRESEPSAAENSHQHQHSMHAKRPMWQSALIGATHCGAGCMLGDVISDSGLFLLGATALIASSALLTSYVFDFIFAYLLGIIFQYFAIVPMRHLSPAEGIWAAIKADTLSLIAFQIGMYAWMAIYQKLIFHPHLEASSPVFWFMMQIGMVAGLITAFPMNWFLVKTKIKEAM